MRATIVRSLTMRKPEMGTHAALSHGDLTVDAAGYLYDAAMRRAVVENGGEASVEVFEALAALRLAAKRIHDAMERFAEGHGLSESRLRVLTRLCHRPSRQLTLGALAEGMDVTPRTMTDIIDVLERDGLVKRVPDPADRRSVQAVITEAGLERINAMRRDASVKQAAVAQGFTADQLVQLRHLCLLLVKNLSSNQEGG
jgi:DNA-binding MarR family transcriptional regulator